MASSVFEVRRFFSFAEITWKISNISLGICPVDMAVDSVNFQVSGIIETSWQMFLRASDDKDEIKIYLKRLLSNRGNNRLYNEISLKVKWMANALDANGELALVSEKEFFFKVNDNLEVQKFDLSKIVSGLPQQGPDDLRIRCYMLIVYKEGMRFPALVSEGIQILHNIWSGNFGNYLFPDFFIKIGKSTFPLHLEMLVNRGKGLNRLIREHGSSQMTLLNFDELSSEALLRFLYGGNVECVLRYPRITIGQHIERLGIRELKNAYPKEKIELESAIESNELELQWRIENMRHVEDSLSGPELTGNGMESRWLLSLHPSGPENASPNDKNYVFIEACLVECTGTIDVSIDITSVNEEGESLLSRRDQKRMNAGEKFSIPFFRRGLTIMNRCLINGDLLLRFKIRIATGGVFVAMGSIQPTASYIINNTLSMKNFARKMLSIFHSPENSDLKIYNDRNDRNKDGKNYESVHKFVLAMRSTTFKQKLAAVKISVLTIPNIRLKFLSIFFEYLYCGFLKPLDLLSLLHLYELSAKFGITELYSQCQKNVVISPSNVLQLLKHADDYDLSNLRREALEFAALMGNDIVGFPDWDVFLRTKTELAVEIMDGFRTTTE